MDKKRDFLGILLAGVTGIALLSALFVRAFLPRVILPRLDATAMVVLSLIALVWDHYILHGSRRDFRLIPVYAALIFGLFPYAASFTAPLDALLMGLMGAAVFTVTTFLFDTMTDRLSTGPASKIAPFISAFGLYLACQCLMGIL